MLDDLEYQSIDSESRQPQASKLAISRRTMLIWLTGIILAEVIASGITWSPVLQKFQPLPSVVGHIVFVSSKGTFDQIEIDLQYIPASPAGKTYYAWLDKVSDSEANAVLHWSLCTDHGAVHCLYPGDSQHNNLLAQNDRFLISEENADSSLVIPDPSARLYYAELSHNGPTTFEVKACPTGNVSNASNPCR